jgi:hypothetical protein
MPTQSQAQIQLAETKEFSAMSDDKFFKIWRKAELGSDAAQLAQIEAVALHRFGPLSRFGMLYMWSYKSAYPEHVRRRHLAAQTA